MCLICLGARILIHNNTIMGHSQSVQQHFLVRSNNEYPTIDDNCEFLPKNPRQRENFIIGALNQMKGWHNKLSLSIFPHVTWTTVKMAAKRSGATQNHDVVVALLDESSSRTGMDGVCICLLGVYWRTNTMGFIPWEDVFSNTWTPKSNIVRIGKHDIQIGKRSSPEVLIECLEAIRSFRDNVKRPDLHPSGFVLDNVLRRYQSESGVYFMPHPRGHYTKKARHRTHYKGYSTYCVLDNGWRSEYSVVFGEQGIYFRNQWNPWSKSWMVHGFVPYNIAFISNIEVDGNDVYIGNNQFVRCKGPTDPNTLVRMIRDLAVATEQEVASGGPQGVYVPPYAANDGYKHGKHKYMKKKYYKGGHYDANAGFAAGYAAGHQAAGQGSAEPSPNRPVLTRGPSATYYHDVTPTAPPPSDPVKPGKGGKGKVDYSSDSSSGSVESSDECSICMNGMKDSVFLPCGHQTACISCAKKLKKKGDNCPICRTPIEKVIKPYKV